MNTHQPPEWIKDLHTETAKGNKMSLIKEVLKITSLCALALASLLIFLAIADGFVSEWKSIATCRQHARTNLEWYRC